MKTYCIDTNIFLRALIKEDSTKSLDCIHFLHNVKQGDYAGVTVSVVLAEIVWVTQSFYQFPKKDSVTMLSAVQNLPNLKIIDRYNYLRALQVFSAKNVKYIDAMIASVEEVDSGDWQVVSYDKDFDKIGIDRKEPRDLI